MTYSRSTDEDEIEAMIEEGDEIVVATSESIQIVLEKSTGKAVTFSDQKQIDPDQLDDDDAEVHEVLMEYLLDTYFGRDSIKAIH